MKLTSWHFLVSGLFNLCAGHETEPMVLSRFDYDYKLMTKIVSLETKLNEHQERINDVERKMKEQEDSLKTSIANFQRISDNVNVAISEGKGTTYVRWGRTSCQSNGTELVYKGLVGGRHYTHKGGAVDYLCLPEDPIWGHYESAAQGNSALIYGGEYEFDHRSRTDFFGKEVHNHDAVCAVCQTRRSRKLMIPGRNRCYDGWTLEYHGYLAAGYYNHDAASEYVCVDENLEVVPNSGADNNGILFYFTEIRCGSLKCPPYVENRELSCVVCSK